MLIFVYPPGLLVWHERTCNSINISVARRCWCCELENVTVGCDSAAGLVVWNMFLLTLSFKVQRHVLKTVCDGAAFHEAVCTRKVAWMGYVTFSWFCVLCVCTMNQTCYLCKIKVLILWMLFGFWASVLPRKTFNTLDNICSLHMPWWSVVAPCLATTIFTATSICRKRGFPSSLRQQSIPLWSGRLFKQWKRMCSVWMQCWCSGSVVLSHPDSVGVFGAVSELKSLKIPSEDTFAYEMNSFWTTAELRHIETWRLVLYLCAEANISSCGDYVGSILDPCGSCGHIWVTEYCSVFPSLTLIFQNLMIWMCRSHVTRPVNCLNLSVSSKLSQSAIEMQVRTNRGNAFVTCWPLYP